MDTKITESDNYAELIKYFMDEFPIELIIGNIAPKNNLEIIALEISNRVIDIQTIFERIENYPTYFKDLYAPENKNIPEGDVLEYHIHSYLNDFYSLEQKIIRLLRFIGNKLSKFNIGNPDDVRNLLKHLESQTENGLGQVVGIRGAHIHNRSVKDSEIATGRIILQAIAFANFDDVRKKLLEQKYKDIIKTSKEKYITQSNDNNTELKKFKNFFACRLGHIIASLYGHDTTRFVKAIKEENL